MNFRKQLLSKYSFHLFLSDITFLVFLAGNSQVRLKRLFRKAVFLQLYFAVNNVFWNYFELAQMTLQDLKTSIYAVIYTVT